MKTSEMKISHNPWGGKKYMMYIYQKWISSSISISKYTCQMFQLYTSIRYIFGEKIYKKVCVIFFGNPVIQFLFYSRTGSNLVTYKSNWTSHVQTNTLHTHTHTRPAPTLRNGAMLWGRRLRNDWILSCQEDIPRVGWEGGEGEGFRKGKVPVR